MNERSLRNFDYKLELEKYALSLKNKLDEIK